MLILFSLISWCLYNKSGDGSNGRIIGMVGGAVGPGAGKVPGTSDVEGQSLQEQVEAKGRYCCSLLRWLQLKLAK